MSTETSITTWLNKYYYSRRVPFKVTDRNIKLIPEVADLDWTGQGADLFMKLIGALTANAVISNVLLNQFIKEKIQTSYTGKNSSWDFKQWAPFRLLSGDRGVYQFVSFDYSEGLYKPEILSINPNKPTLACSWPMDMQVLQTADLAQQVAKGKETDPNLFLKTLKPANLATLQDSLHEAADYALKNPPEVPYFRDERDFWHTNPNAQGLLTVLKEGVIGFTNR